MSVLFALCTLCVPPDYLESAQASLEQVLTTFLPLFCCDPWPFCCPASYRWSLGTRSHLWSPPVKSYYHGTFSGQLCICERACLWYTGRLPWEKLLPLLTLQVKVSINNSATHCRTQCCTQCCVIALNLPCRFLSVHLWLLLYTHFVSFPLHPSFYSVLPTVCVSVKFPLKLTISKTSHYCLY